MCRNGRYTEHGIKALDGFAAEQYVLPLDAAVAVPNTLGDVAVLVEPASVVAKAWEHIDRIGGRAAWSPRRVLVTGAVNRELVLENDVVFGSVNANTDHYLAAVDSLSAADLDWLRRLISRRVPLGDWPAALERQDDDVKVVVDLTA